MSYERKLNLDLSQVELVNPINWNEVDEYEMDIWNKVVQNFWVPEKIALSNDLPSWANFTEEEKWATSRVFAGLTMLDTIQSEVGAVSLIPDARTDHEAAIYTNFSFMEAIHAKSYSSIFSTLLSTTEINDVFRWSKEDENLKRKAATILHYYRGMDAEKRKIASVMLESFLFYSGFFMPLWWSGKSKLTNTADIIFLIIRDEALHGNFIGSRFQLNYKEASPERQAELKKFTEDLFWDLYDNEVKYTASIYDDLGLTEEVKTFLKYNANKAFDNLGFEHPFTGEETQVHPSILSSLNPGAETHDFFSGSGSSYVIGRVEESQDDDWDF